MFKGVNVCVYVGEGLRRSFATPDPFVLTNKICLNQSTTPLDRPCHQDGCLPHATTNPLWRTCEGFKEKRSAKEAVQRLHKDLETVQLTPSRPGDKCSG